MIKLRKLRYIERQILKKRIIFATGLTLSISLVGGIFFSLSRPVDFVMHSPAGIVHAQEAVVREVDGPEGVREQTGSLVSEFDSQQSHIGYVSYYTLAGCLGCNDERITASGEVLDDSKLTFAVPAEWRKNIKMGTKFRVTNRDNGLSVVARANDTGGFLKYNRIADLSLATCRAIKCETDSSLIEITKL